jgi:radical SAM superfamily enzyme YgiQ (UPF0313 family)
MRVTLIGADFEENLGIGILAAVLEKHGHVPSILPFNVAGDTSAVVQRVMAEQPEMVGLSIQFQHRAHEFLGLSKALRRAGYRGHVTSGAQFPTLAFKEVLEGDFGVDSVVLHDGEETLVDLVRAVEDGSSLGDVAGLALRSSDGVAFRTPERRMPDDLDTVPFAARYRPHNQHLGVPFVPIIGGRGCWSKCSYCSIVAFYRDGREHGGGRLFRVRSPENIAAEMALLWHRAGRPAIFCFHDDNFTMPSPERTLERVRAIRGALDDYGVGRIGIVGKARPDTITPELAQQLAKLGVIRLYVGVENGSQEGGDHLRRGTQQNHVRGALAACREAGIFNCYNLLVFEPKATLETAKENLAFIRDHAEHPVNFCRAEPYHGTPLHLELSREQDLGGSYLGWNYSIEDDRAELLFRICSAAFRERNFAPRGVANRYMGLGYAGNVLRRFYPGERSEALREKARLLTRAISLDSARFFEQAIELAESAAPSDHDRVEQKTARLALDVAAADAGWHEELDDLYDAMNAEAAAPREKERFIPTAKLMKLVREATFSATLAAAATVTLDGCGGMVVDPVPTDAGMDSMVVDPPPPDAGRDTPAMSADTPDSGFVVDPAPEDAPVDTGFVVDPPPPDAGMAAADREAEDDRAYAESGALKRRLRLVDQWRDSAPVRSVRTADLALSEPPAPRLVGKREDGVIRVRIEDVPGSFGTRWEAEGELAGEGPEITWVPATERSHVRVAVRSRRGVAVVTLRASDV